MKKLILAYSGGLDTSVILSWLVEKGFEVVCFVADLGQDEDFERVREKAFQIGARKVFIEDLRQEFVDEYIFKALKARAVYEGRYLLGTSLARPLIAKKQIDIALLEKCSTVAHGATGKGNDQVRFEIAYHCLMPHATIISPWKDQEFLNQFRGRTDMIAYARARGIPITSTLKKPYSMDENLMHTSYEAGILEDPAASAPPDLFQRTVAAMEAPDTACEIAIEFLRGEPICVTNLSTHEKVDSSSLALFSFLNALAKQHGIGRIDIVENRFIGMKSRGVYETPAGTLLWKAHQDLEALVLDREVMYLKEMLMPKIAHLIYNGLWFSPEMDFLMAAIEKSQEYVSGTVCMTLYKGNAHVTRRFSPHSLYSHEVASMDRPGDFDPQDAKGFIAITSLRLKQHHKRRIQHETLG